MSIVSDNSPASSAPRPAAVRGLGGGFIVLLILAVLWPEPIVSVNDTYFQQPLAVGERSFLGREAPSWDAVFLGLVGLYALILMHGRLGQAQESMALLAADLRALPAQLSREAKRLIGLRALLTVALFCAAVGMVWYLLDAPLIAAAESVQSPRSRSAIRLMNRLGGGMNAPMVIGFFLVAGLALARRQWLRVALAMALASLSGGIVVHLLKYLVGRSRPELWLGPFHHAGPSSNSFPSGHTVGAFAIATVILLGAHARSLKAVAILLAIAIATSRVVAFRHWPSDVFTSSMIGLLFGWFYVRATRADGVSSEESPAPEQS